MAQTEGNSYTQWRKVQEEADEALLCLSRRMLARGSGWPSEEQARQASELQRHARQLFEKMVAEKRARAAAAWDWRSDRRSGDGPGR